MAVIYINREGEKISKQDWKELQTQDSYKVVRLYDNGVVHLQLTWIGRIDNPDTFQSYWKNFILTVKNYRSDGSLVNDPVDGDRTFSNEAEGIKAYEDFLLHWTDCSVDDEAKFVERGNTLELPLPPDPNRPEGGVFEVDGMNGAW